MTDVAMQRSDFPVYEAGMRLYEAAEKEAVESARVKALDPIDYRLSGQLAKAFKAQGSIFLNALPRNGGVATWVDSWVEASGITRQAFVEPIDIALATSMVAGANFNISNVGAGGISFGLADPRASWWLSEHGAELVKGVEGETKNRLRAIIADARAEGLAYTKLASNIRSEFTDMSRKRARLIATTETAFGYEAGNRFAADQMREAGLLLEKKHLPIGDSCPLCKGNAKMGWIDSEDPFEHGPVPVHPGCRCTNQYRKAGVRGSDRPGESRPSPRADQARELFKQGMSVNDVRKATGMTYAQALGIKRRLDAAGGLVAPKGAAKTARAPRASKGPQGPAQTFEEFDARMKKINRKMDLSYRKPGVGPGGEEDWSFGTPRISLKQANEILSAMERVKARYPYAFSKLKEFAVRELSGDIEKAWAVVWPGRRGSSRMELNELWIKDPAKFEQSMKFSAETRWHHGKGTLEEVIIHESGHVVDNYWLDKPRPGGQHYKSQEIAGAGVNLSNGVTGSNAVTRYGRTNWRENFAEGFTDLFVVPKTNWHPMVHLIEKVLE